MKNFFKKIKIARKSVFAFFENSLRSNSSQNANAASSLKNILCAHRGFALLFAVLAASVLLSIGLSIFNLTVKELSLSAYGRESQFSFYAADSGAECALYWDIKGNAGATFATSTTYSGVSPYQISCGGTILVLSKTSSDAHDATTTFSMSLPPNDGSGKVYCAAVVVSKSDPNGDGLSNTNINSSGYNVCNSSAVPTWGNPNLVERTLNVSY